MSLRFFTVLSPIPVFPKVLRRADVSKASILKVYLTTIRPVLEYAVPVWQSIPDYLADVIRRVIQCQKGHLRQFALRRNPQFIRRPWVKQTCQHCKREEKIYDVNIREKIKSRDHPLFKLLPRPVEGTCNYNLRKNSRNFFYLMAQLLVGPRRQIHFFTFRYFK